MESGVVRDVRMQLLSLKTILVATEPEDASTAAILAASRLAGAAGASLHAVFVASLNRSGSEVSPIAEAEASLLELFRRTGLSGLTVENRTGGTVDSALLPNGAAFTERRNTRRGDGGAVAHIVLREGLSLDMRASATGEWSTRRFGPVIEHDRRTTSFSEGALNAVSGSHDLVLGAAFEGDALSARESRALNCTFSTPALFAQDTWTPTEWFGATGSARVDQHSRYGTMVSPRLSLLFKLPREWSARLSAGAGAYAPTPFVEETEAIGLLRLRPLRGLEAERARSGAADIGGLIGLIEVNASLHSSVIEHPVGLRAATGAVLGSDSVELVSTSLLTHAGGGELFARYRLGHYSVTGTYAYLRATEQDPESFTVERRGVPLTPRHAAGAIASWEPKDDTGLAVEGFYTGRQPLADDPYRTESRPYVMVGALAQCRFGRAVGFVNGEKPRQRSTNAVRTALATDGRPRRTVDSGCVGAARRRGRERWRAAHLLNSPRRFVACGTLSHWERRPASA